MIEDLAHNFKWVKVIFDTSVAYYVIALSLTSALIVHCRTLEWGASLIVSVLVRNGMDLLAISVRLIALEDIVLERLLGHFLYEL